MRNLWEFAVTPKSERGNGHHPSQKPLALVERLVLVASKPMSCCSTPSAGTGTLAVAAQRHGRRWLLIESDSRVRGSRRDDDWRRRRRPSSSTPRRTARHYRAQRLSPQAPGRPTAAGESGADSMMGTPSSAASAGGNVERYLTEEVQPHFVGRGPLRRRARRCRCARCSASRRSSSCSRRCRGPARRVAGTSSPPCWRPPATLPAAW